MNILNIFYDEIVKEASCGQIQSYFTYNIIFSTNIEDKENFLVDVNYNGTLIPTLYIKDKQEFDKLLIEYVDNASVFYPSEEFSDLDVGDDFEHQKIKTILALLFSNATYEDFNDPCAFLRKRINFMNNSMVEDKDVGYSQVLKSSLKFSIKKDRIFNETPYQFSLSAIDDDNLEYDFPSIKFGINNGKAYIYAIQNDRKNLKESKKVNRALYKIGEGFDSKSDNAEIYDEGNLNDVTASFLVVLNAFLGYLSKIGIREIEVPSILVERWNAKEIVQDKKLDNGYISLDEYHNKSKEHVEIQNNLTEKLLRTVLRLGSHYPYFKVLSMPMEIDSSLHVDVSNFSNCNNRLLNEVRELVFDSISDRKSM